MRIIFDDAEFDRVVHNSLPECGEEHFAIVCKDHATAQGNAAACITFISMTEAGPKRVQIVVTVRNLLQAFGAVAARYPLMQERQWAPPETPKELSGHVDGVGWDALFMEQMYFIQCENGATGMAATEETARGLAASLCRTQKLQ